MAAKSDQATTEKKRSMTNWNINNTKLIRERQIQACLVVFNKPK